MEVIDYIVAVQKKWETEKEWDPKNVEMTRDFEMRFLVAPGGQPKPNTAYADYLRRNFGK